MSALFYDDDVYCGYIIRGDLRGAMDYIGRFPACKELADKYDSLFVEERYLSFDMASELDVLLRIYQRYYRDVFYLRLDKDDCAGSLKNGLSRLLGITDAKSGVDELEQGPVTEAFRRRGLHFQGGKTGGFYGPYVWKTTEAVSYDVELPGGTRKYTVKLLDGFITKGWIDYISFGKLGTGGWTDGDGVICCIKSSYDLDSEAFSVSLLKHEAQHALDLECCPDMSSEMLEYRAKLVELIYSTERKLLPQFVREADSSPGANGHALASSRLTKGILKKLKLKIDELNALPITLVQETARELFQESERTGFTVE